MLAANTLTFTGVIPTGVEIAVPEPPDKLPLIYTVAPALAGVAVTVVVVVPFGTVNV
jgi:hypothetical protein